MAALADWQADGMCRGSHGYLFFPPPAFERKDERSRREERAKAICRACPVLEACAEYAVSTGELFGIWGGMTENERRLTLVGA